MAINSVAHVRAFKPRGRRGYRLMRELGAPVTLCGAPATTPAVIAEPTEPDQLYGPHGVELPSFDDDWFRFFHQPGDRNDVRFFEVHEMCRAASCSFRPGTWCPFHPIGCDCSWGACQDDDERVVIRRMERAYERVRLG